MRERGEARGTVVECAEVVACQAEFGQAGTGVGEAAERGKAVVGEVEDAEAAELGEVDEGREEVVREEKSLHVHVGGQEGSRAEGPARELQNVRCKCERLENG